MDRLSAERQGKQPRGREPPAQETQRRFRKLVSQLDDLRGDVSELSRQAGLTQEAVSELRLVEARHEIRAVQRRLDGLGSEVEEVERGVEGVGARFDGFTSRVEGVELGMKGVGPRLDGLTSEIGGIAQAVKGVERLLNRLASEAEVAGRDIAGMAARIDASNAAVGEAAEAASARVGDVTSQVEVLASQVEGLRSQLTNLNSRLDLVDRMTKDLRAQSETSEEALARILEVRREVRALRRGLRQVSELREEVGSIRQAIAELREPEPGRRRSAIARKAGAGFRPFKKAGRRIRRYLRIARRNTRRSVRRARAGIRRGLRSVGHRFFGPRLGRLDHHRPRELRVPRRYFRPIELVDPPVISIVTPSFNQAQFVGQTIQSVIDQRYPRLEYIIQDGGSTDETPVILERYLSEFHHHEAGPDNGQAHAINLGFRHATGQIMSYLNADDLLLPGTLGYVARFFERHPEVDVVYGHRVIVDDDGKEIGRWILPRHDAAVLSWADYVPQETLYWRRSLWDVAEISLNEECSFALDWDLMLRFRDADARIVRLPRFLGAFRVHGDQKTSAQIDSAGVSEMARIRAREQGREVSRHEIRRNIRGYMLRHVVLHGLYRAHLLRY